MTRRKQNVAEDTFDDMTKRKKYYRRPACDDTTKTKQNKTKHCIFTY
jgi:hypothetical protein